MGSILEAADCKLGRNVAVKTMLSAMETDEHQKQRFINEAAVLATLEHPNIVPHPRSGPRLRRPPLRYTMKLVQGHTLQAILNALRGGDPTTTSHYTLDRLLNDCQPPMLRPVIARCSRSFETRLRTSTMGIASSSSSSLNAFNDSAATIRRIAWHLAERMTIEHHHDHRLRFAICGVLEGI